MSNILGAGRDRVRPGWRKMARRSAVIGALAAAALLGRALPAEAFAPQQAACMPELARLSAEWDALGSERRKSLASKLFMAALGSRALARRSSS